VSNFDASTEHNGTWTLLDVEIPAGELELVSDLLWSLGVVAIEELDGTIPATARLRTSLGGDPQAVIASIVSRHGAARCEMVRVDKAVADTWRQHAEVTVIEGPLAIVPAWLEAPAGCDAVLIEPADTFGLGNHPTTVGALTLAMRHVAAGARVFDLGTGSGILAVALAKQKGCPVLVTDIAAGARDVVAHNAALNALTGIDWTDTGPAAPVDAVLANILAPVLIAESRRIVDHTRDQGTIVLSGMRSEQLDAVLEHYGDCEVFDSVTIDGWTSVALVKNR
jgi:ribosomal protein L11 methyltransferase